MTGQFEQDATSVTHLSWSGQTEHLAPAPCLFHPHPAHCTFSIRAHCTMRQIYPRTAHYTVQIALCLALHLILILHRHLVRGHGQSLVSSYFSVRQHLSQKENKKRVARVKMVEREKDEEYTCVATLLPRLLQSWLVLPGGLSRAWQAGGGLQDDPAI